MPTFTPNYSFYLPLVNNATDQDLWGGYLNSNFSSLDTLLAAIQPSGEIKFFPTNTAPSGYLETNGSLVSRTTYPNLYAFATASGNISAADTSAVGSGSIYNPGSSYTAGTYTNVSMTGGSGSGLAATIVVNSSGNVSSVTLTSNTALAVGSAYVVGDLLSCAASSIGGTGSGFEWQVQSLTGWDKGMFSPGDGVTTFRIPDYRGSFLRGWADNGSVDAGRTIGSSQVDAIASHSVSVSVSDLGHNHPSQLRDGAGADNQGFSGYQTNNANTGTAYTNTGYANIVASGSYTGASETRPRNIAGMYCIKT